MELVVIEERNISGAFKKDGLNPFIEKIKKEADSFQHGDLTVKKNRDEIASFAHKIARSKTYLDGLGKELVTSIKLQSKVIDSERKSMRDQLDTLKEKVRKPLTEWEAEQKRIEEERKAAEQYENDWIEALEYDKIVNEKRAIEKEKAELERQRIEKEKAEKEAKLKLEQEKREKEAAEKARLEAEQKAAEEITKAKEAEIKAKLEAERIEQESKEAEIRAEKARIEAAEKAKREKEAAIEAERKKVEDQKKVEAAAEAKRKANIEHMRTINNQSKTDLVTGGIDSGVSESVIKLIASGKIRNISIKY